MPDLKNCPYCGGPATSITNPRDMPHYEVRCLSSKCGEGVAFDNEDKAIKAWNTRAPHTKAHIKAAAQAMALHVNIWPSVTLNLTDMAKAALKAAGEVNG